MRQAARLLGIGRHVLYRACEAGELAIYDPRGWARVKLTDVAAWLERTRRQPEGTPVTLWGPTRGTMTGTDPALAALDREAKQQRLLPTVERVRRLADLNAKIRSAGLREEWLILQLEAAEVRIDRREDGATRRPSCASLCDSARRAEARASRVLETASAYAGLRGGGV